MGTYPDGVTDVDDWAEVAVLGAALIEARVCREAYALLESGDFTDPVHQAIFCGIRDLLERDERVDEITALREAAKYSREPMLVRVAELAEAVPTPVNVMHYARQIKNRSLLHQAADVAAEIAARTQMHGATADDILSRGGDELAEVQRRGGSMDMEPAGEVLKRVMRELQARYEGKTEPGVSTGYPDLDAAIGGGMQPGQLVVVAGRPGMGKTSLALGALLRLSERKRRAMMFSLEMPAEEVMQRQVSARSGVHLTKLRDPRGMQAADWPRIGNATGVVADGLCIVDSMVTIDKLRAVAMRHTATVGVDLIVVDYLQLMQGRGGEQSREREVAAISAGLKGLAKDIGCPVMALSQLNRAAETRESKKPGLADLRESGAIEQDADIVLLVYRGDYYQTDASQHTHEAEIAIAKNRNGPTGMVKLRWNAPVARFDSLART